MASITAQANLRRRVAEVDASISGLQYTRLALLRQLDAAAPSYPILTNISREVTSRIFVHCLDPLSYGHSTTSPRYAPMLLLHVCRTWRSIALSTPELWANLTLDFRRMSWALFQGATLENFIEDCVARAGTLPLSLHVNGGCSWEHTEKVQHLIPTILKRLSSRIQTLDLNIDLRHYPEDTPGFPLLQKLKLRLLNLNAFLPGNHPIRIFSAAPQLRELSMQCGATPSLFSIPGAKLTVFSGHRLSTTECVDVLRMAPSLIECHFEEPELDPDTPAISHSGLKSLTISLLGDNSSCEFLTLPTLQNLKISLYDFENVQPILPFISGLSASLLKLSWGTSPPLEVPLMELSAMGALTELKLCDPLIESVAELFTLLDLTKHHNFLPQLQVLELDQCAPYVNAILVDALSSRRALRSFRQFWVYNTPADALQGYYREEGLGVALEELIRKGLEIYIGLRNTQAPGPGAWLFNQPRL
ncbi:F-box domain-containing protein [Mycena venus]|uniref:F-box domain-containing protein n=1 Tax=Mycena venus TaxID=2733690 RepID=A0A8H7CYM2_9AGAR|nr:F-box domain-containing protein [Mycena venus]